MSDKGLKIGIIGLGVGVNAHIPAARIEGFEVAALAARDLGKVNEAADRLGVEARYDSAEALLAHPGLDAVAIATPPTSHRELVLKALDAGKHVMLEKPFSMNGDEARELHDRAAASGRTAMIAHAFRHAPARAYVKSLIEAGYIGKPKGVSMTFFTGPKERPVDSGERQSTLQGGPVLRQHWRMGMASGGGFSNGPMSTFFDSLIDWLGPVKAISGRTLAAHPGAVQANGAPADADETVSANFEFENGAWGQIAASVVSPFGPGGHIHILGEDGALEIRQPLMVASAAETVFGGRFADGAEIRALEIPAEFFQAPHEGDPKPDLYRAYRPLYRDFAAGIAQNRSPSPHFADAWMLQRISNGLQESNRTGAWVQV